MRKLGSYHHCLVHLQICFLISEKKVTSVIENNGLGGIVPTVSLEQVLLLWCLEWGRSSELC